MLGTLRLKRIATRKKNDQAPEIEGTTLNNHNPWKLSSEYAKEKPILLVLWASWCKPCRAETPALKALWERFGKGDRLQIIGLNLDRGKQKAAQAVASQSLLWPQYHIGAWGESNPVTNAYGVASIPSNWLISPEGHILADRISSDALEETLEKHLAEQ